MPLITRVKPSSNSSDSESRCSKPRMDRAMSRLNKETVKKAAMRITTVSSTEAKLTLLIASQSIALSITPPPSSPPCYAYRMPSLVRASLTHAPDPQSNPHSNPTSEQKRSRVSLKKRRSSTPTATTTERKHSAKGDDRTLQAQVRPQLGQLILPGWFEPRTCCALAFMRLQVRTQPQAVNPSSVAFRTEIPSQPVPAHSLHLKHPVFWQ